MSDLEQKWKEELEKILKETKASSVASTSSTPSAPASAPAPKIATPSAPAPSAKPAASAPVSTDSDKIIDINKKIQKSSTEFNSYLKKTSVSGLEAFEPVMQTPGKNEWKITDKLTLQITDTLDIKIIPDGYVPSDLEAYHVKKLTEIVVKNKGTTTVVVVSK